MATRSEKAASAILIRRVKRAKRGAQPAAWKIAYADFMTAMMAFFLLMWLLGSTTKGDLRGIAEHFLTPLQVSLLEGPGVGNANTVVTGGGDDTTQSLMETKRSEIRAVRRHVDELVRIERLYMEDLQRRIHGAILGSRKLDEFKNQLLVEITPDGLRIQIVDDLKRPMFDTGSAHVKEYMGDILREFGKILNDVDRKIVVAGHTDSAQYAAGDRDYSNWELSIDRANAARRELIAGEMNPTKIVRVVGLADSSPLDSVDAMNPLNRRISIIVLNKVAEKRMSLAGGEIEAGDAAGLERSIGEGDSNFKHAGGSPGTSGAASEFEGEADGTVHGAPNLPRAGASGE